MVEHTTENRGVGGSIPPLTTAPTLVLLCAPSMGILDNWLPVLHAARASHPDWRIVALIPDRETLAQLDATNTAHVLADEVIDTTVAPLVGGGWIGTPGLLAARDAAAPGRGAAVLRRAIGHDGPSRIDPLLYALRTRAQRRATSDPALLAGDATRLLCDPTVHDKRRLAPVLRALSGVGRHTMLHGIALLAADGTQTAVPSPDDERAAYLFAHTERPAYRDGFGIPDDRLHVVGVARHEPAWVERVVERSRALHTVPFEHAIVLMSRPAGSPFLPRERKVRLLRELHEVATEEHGLPLLIRAHPKERSDGTFAEALPADGEGRTWAFSGAHPFHLARHARLGVVLFSGVAVDLVALGVPVIQLLDVEGLNDVEDGRAPRDPAGKRRFGPYVRDGLVHAADGADELRALLSDVAGLLAPLRARHDALLPDPAGSAGRIVTTIARDLAGGHPGDD